MNTIFVLLMIISGGNKMGSINQEFTSKERCEAALESLANPLKPAGFTVYATCSPK